MRIVEKINEILSSMVAGGDLASYQYLTPSKHNVAVAKGVQFPRAMFSAITDRQISISKMRSNETAEVVIDFCTLSNLKTTEFGADTMEAKIDAMGDIALQFVKCVVSERSLMITTDNIELTSLYDFTDTNLTGVRLRLTIKDKIGNCL